MALKQGQEVLMYRETPQQYSTNAIIIYPYIWSHAQHWKFI